MIELSTIRIAWRNLGRHKRRTALAVMAIAVGQCALLAMMGLMRGYADNIRRAITGPMIGHLQVHAKDYREERAVDLAIQDAVTVAASIAADPLIESASRRIYAPVLVAPKQDAFAAMVVGVEVDVESRDYGLLSGMKEKLAPQRVLVGYRLARKINVKTGDELAVVGQSIDGSLANDLFIVQDVIKSPADLVNQAGLVMNLADAERLLLMEEQAHEIVVRCSEGGHADTLETKLMALPELAGLEAKAWTKLVPELVVILKTSDYVGYFVVALVFVAAITGIANTLMMSTFERMHEFGMLLALGSRPSRLVRMIVVEAVLLGFIGVVIGTAMGYAFVFLTSGSGIDMASWGGDGELSEIAYKGLQLPLHVFPRLELKDTMLGLIAVVVTSLLASIWPAWITSRLEPMEAMRR